MPQGQPERWSTDIRRAVASGLVTIGVLCALFAGVFRYVDQHFHTEETFLENTSELANDAGIRTRLFEGFRGEIIRLADGDIVEEEEPLSDAALALEDLNQDDEPDPVTEQRILRDLEIESILVSVFNSEAYDDAFAGALERSHLQLIAAANLESEELLGNSGEVFFNMRELYRTINPALAANALTAEIPSNEVPDSYGIFKVADRETTLDFLWTILRKGQDWAGPTTLAAILCLIGAVAIAERRPSTAIQFGGGAVGVGVVLIVIVYLIRFIVPLLASGSTSADPVVATYVATTSPLVSMMIRLLILGVAIAVVGGIAKLIWPDDWVYSSVSDDRGVRSVRHRRGKKEPEAERPVAEPVGAAAPAGYPAYPQGPYGYPQPQWSQQPYPGQYPPGYGYPVGPYGQPQAPLAQGSQQYASPGRPTVPVMPVSGSELVPPAAPPLEPGSTPKDLPADAAQIVPRVVAKAEESNSTVFEDAVAGDADDSALLDDDATQAVEVIEASGDRDADGKDDGDSNEWASERDW